MMTISREKRRALKFGVRTRLIPHVQSLGFERPHTKANRRHWPEFTPETDFGRIRGSQTEFLDIQWERYGSPKFVMNFGFGPTEALHQSWEAEWKAFNYQRLQSGYYGVPWGMLGFGGVWFGPGQSAEAAIDLAIQRVSELSEALEQGDAASLACLVERGYTTRTGPGSWWLRHVGTDVPRGVFALDDWIRDLSGRSRP
jgi:hypothetical protein